MHGLDTFRQDILYSIRTLRKQPGFSILVVLVLTIGIGANTAVFTLVNALLFRPLPVKDPASIVGIYTSDFSGSPYGTSSYPDYLDFRAQTKTLSGIAACGITPVSVLLHGVTERIFVETVSGNYFSVLGIQPERGRGFDSKDESAPGKSPVVVISYAMWKSHFNGDPQIVGRVISINGNPYTITGVAPEKFEGMTRGLAVSMWIPLAMQAQIVPGNNDLVERGGRSLFLFGRLQPGAKFQSAQAEFAVIALQMHKQFPEQWSSLQNTPRKITVLPESASRIFPQARLPVIAFMGLLMVIVFIVLLVACANVANLLLARAASRQKEIAIRLSLGAGRWRLVRQLITESLLLSFLSAVLGALLAFWGIHLLMLLRPPVPVPIHLDLSMDQRVLFFTIGLSVITGLFFGLTPALQATRPDYITALKNESALDSGTHKSRLRSVITVTQLSLSVLLLIAALLCARSLRNAATLNPGFDPSGILLASMDLNLQGYNQQNGLSFYQRLIEQVRQIPEVKSATFAKELPLAISSTRMSITIQDYKSKPGEDMEIHTTWIGPDYFRTLNIPMLRGRGFDDRDSPSSKRVAIVNQEFAKRYWPNQDPLGKQIRIGSNVEELDAPSYEVIGIARDSKYSYLGEEQIPFFYLPLFQRYESSVTLVLKTDQQPNRVISKLRDTIQRLDRNLPLYDIKTMDQHLGLALLPARLAGSALGLFGTFAWILSTLGIYGVVSYMVTRRTREIGIRIAIGASQTDVLRLILSHGTRLTAIGILIGTGIGLVVMRFLSFLLYDVNPTDPITFIIVPLALAAVALIAAYIPARRATKVNPTVALRYE